ncbi:NADP-dependent oxidoreductase [Psychrobacter sp. FDAARGOS_221]|uniref:NADP-dependent oxidoreductase n=1 Tax=Psychrobacter sp. FDAARGOS_221 TaxID=1975705 RepID=UPI000C9EEF63|nr:NADP-dependent oxidoreductase [Psychrobacter sp. FDAARGOS_221]PNK60637.1 NADP-dependent oxidoreductase [Psychrobacter sp. FDAARGOS_221]
MSSTYPQTQSAITITEFGETDVLHYQKDVAVPELADNQVLVKVAYAGINPVDYKTRQGLGWGAENIKNNQFARNEPAVLGFDMAGEVVASNSSQFKVGDKVAALNFKGGCYAQYNTVDADLLAKVPESVDLKTAGALPCVGTTAYQMLRFADIKAGEHVVMSAPAGGVGHLALQMLAHLVTEKNIKLTVICSPEKYEKLGGLIDTSKLAGWIDYTKDEAFSALQADLLLDLVGGDAGVLALSVLKDDGRVVVLPSIWVDKLKQAGPDSLTIEGFIAKPNAQDLDTVLQQLADNKLTLHIQQSYPLAKTAEAHKALETGDTFGKIVLEMA